MMQEKRKIAHFYLTQTAIVWCKIKAKIVITLIGISSFQNCNSII